MKAREIISAAVVFTIPFLIYSKIIHSGFLADDYGYLPLCRITWQNFVRCIELIHDGRLALYPFRPVVLLSYILDYSVWGQNSAAFHITNIFLHSLNAVMVWRLVGLLGKDWRAAFLSGLVFGIFPGHVEAVAWISGRFDILCQSFFLASLLLWLAGRRLGNSWILSFSSLTLLLSLFSKETPVIGVMIFPLIDLLFFRDKFQSTGNNNRGFMYAWIGAQFAMVLLLVLTRTWLYGSAVGDSIWTQEGSSHPPTIGDLSNNMVYDLKMLLVPVNRMLFDNWVISMFEIVGAALCAIALFRIVAAVVKKDLSSVKLLIFALIWIIALLIPTLIFSPVMDTLENSRYLYMPSMGFAIIAGLCMDNCNSNARYRRLVPIIALVIWIACAFWVLERQLDAWSKTSIVAENVAQVIEDNTRDICDNATVVVINLPWLWEGMRFAPNGFDSYLNMVQGRTHLTLTYIEKDRSGLESWLDSVDQSGKQYWCFIWDEMDQKLIPLE